MFVYDGTRLKLVYCSAEGKLTKQRQYEVLGSHSWSSHVLDLPFKYAPNKDEARRPLAFAMSCVRYTNFCPNIHSVHLVFLACRTVFFSGWLSSLYIRHFNRNTQEYPWNDLGLDLTYSCQLRNSGLHWLGFSSDCSCCCWWNAKEMLETMNYSYLFSSPVTFQAST